MVLCSCRDGCCVVLDLVGGTDADLNVEHLILNATWPPARTGAEGLEAVEAAAVPHLQPSQRNNLCKVQK
jgi:hypothetical protein